VTPAQADALRELFESQRVAALGTLHEGEPWVSMAPFALLPAAAGFVIHVSALAQHTGDLNADPRASLLVVAAERPGTPPQARARVTVRVRAERCADGSPEQAAAREAYLARFPQAAGIVGLGGFSFFVLRPLAARVIGGFAQAETISAAELVGALAGA
jgi:putative heme iron utilization protein